MTVLVVGGVVAIDEVPTRNEARACQVRRASPALVVAVEHPRVDHSHDAPAPTRTEPRGGHLDLAVLGAYQVAQNGDLANWRVGSKGVPAVGGAMDLVHGAKRVAVVTDHVTKEGGPKLVETCTFPLTGVGCVTRVYTSLAVVDIEGSRFVLREKLPVISMEELQAVTGALLHIDGPVGDLIVPEGI